MFGFLTRRPWAIHNPLKSWTLADLSLRECQLLVASMSDIEMKVSWAFHESWSDWKPLSEPGCHDLFLHHDESHPVLPPLPQMIQDDDHEITEVRVLATAPVSRDLVTRKHPRYQAKIPVEIMVSSYSFVTHTQDLSLGGFCFEDKLPDWVAGYFTVVLNTPDKMFEFTCILAEDQKKDKFRAEIAPSTSESVIADFRVWLNSQNFPESPQKNSKE